MGQKDKYYIAFFVLSLVLYIGYQVFSPQPVDWSDSYRGDHKIPFGTYILHEELGTLFPDQQITVTRQPPFELLSRGDTGRAAGWIYINNAIEPDPLETEKLLGWVADGNNLFISASVIGRALADSLGFSVSYHTLFSARELDLSEGLSTYPETELSFDNPHLQDNGTWTFNAQRIAYFSSADTVNTTRLGLAGDDRVNFIRITHGEGDVFIHLFPRAFTNYYLREPDYAGYAFRALSYLPVGDVIWDEYYKAGRRGYSTPMGYILSETPLRRAWFLTLAAVVLFMIFRGRREQRAIQVLKKPENSTLQFAETIGSLYLEKGNNKMIAEKKIRFFMEWCRRELEVELSEAAESEAGLISDRSGVPTNETGELLMLITEVTGKAELTAAELISLNTKIDQFYKKSLR
jgi:hypothetical protein